MKRWLKCLAVCAWACAGLGLGTDALAAYPEKPITLVIGFTSGGPTDAVGRYLARKLEAELGQPVVVENRTGANGVVALQVVKRAPADGYTLMLGSSGTLAIEPVYKQKVDYDVLRDFTPISLVATYPYLLVVPASSPFKTVDELIAGARSRPDTLTFASAGSGAVNHLAGEWFKSALKLQITHIPYKGDSVAIADLVTARVDMAFLSIVAANPQIQNGKMRALAVASAEPTNAAPGMVTVAKAAGIPGFEAAPWNGVLAPAGLPAEITNKLNTAIRRVMDTDDAKAVLLNLGLYPLSSTPEAFAQHIRTQTERWRQVIESAQIPKSE